MGFQFIRVIYGRKLIRLSQEYVRFASTKNGSGLNKVFDIVFAITRGGPAHVSETLTTYMYYQSFAVYGTNEMGYASVISVTLTLIVLVFAVIRVNLEKRQLSEN